MDSALSLAVLNAAYAGLGAANVFTSGQRINAPFGLNTPPIARQPFNSQQRVDAAAAGTVDKIGHELATTLTGNFAASSGSNPTFGWGLNVFTATGTAAGDGAGATIQNLIESDVLAPSGTIAAVQGLSVQAAFYGATAGATVSQMESLRVAAPARKDGATGGIATKVYGLFVEDVEAGPVGATGGAFSVFVAGGISRFGGRVDVTNNISNAGTGDLTVFADFTAAAGSLLTLKKASNGGDAQFTLNAAGATVKINNGTTDVFKVDRSGRLFLATGTTPGANAAGGQIFVAGDGTLHYLSPGGTNTQLAAA
jgi:hypothetical protein